MSTPRSIRVLLFAGLRQAAGRDQLELSVSPPVTVATLRAQLERAHPELGPLTHCRFAVDHAFADPSATIPPEAEVALIPPVSGGHDGPKGAHGDTQGSTHLGHRSALGFAPLTLDAVVDAVRRPEAGGLTTFTGQVRRHSRGKEVQYLEYEAYAPMAIAVMDRIAEAIEARIPETRVCIHHRLGHLEIGEVAVIIAASAPHRAEAFEACRAAIEALKQDVPIWKKEVDRDGAAWIGQGP